MRINDYVFQLEDVYYNEHDDTLIGYFICSLKYLKTKIN